MKPVSLAFSGLNSYRGLQTVDFAALAEPGLFGIFGPTGAGKSTILDAITLALYGEVERAANKTQGIINVREKTCFVQFRFALAGHIYTAERLYERKKDDDYASRGKSCRLIEDETRVLADKSEEMTRTVEALLGMNLSRFCQTVILPQGKFDKLLTMAPAERSALVEELFHFSAYGEALLKKLRLKLKSSSEALQALKEQRLLLGDCTDRHILELEEKEQELAQALALAAARLAQAREQLSQSEMAEHQARELAEHQAGLEELAAGRQEIQALEQSLAQAKAAERLRPQLEAATELNQQLQAAKEALGEAYLAAIACRKGRQQLLAKAEQQARQARRGEAALEARRKVEKITARLEAAGQMALAQQAEEQRLYQAWQLAEEQAEAARRDSAAAFLAGQLQPGQPCPVCGSREHQPPAQQAGEEAAAQALQEAKKAKAAWRQQSLHCETGRQTLASLREEGEQLRREADQALAAAEKQAAELEILGRQISADLTELDALTAPLSAEPGFTDWLQAAEATPATAGSEPSQVKLALAMATGNLDTARRRLAQARERSVALAAEAGFPTVNQAKKALLSPETLQAGEERLREYDRQWRLHSDAAERLGQQLAGYDRAQRGLAEAAYRTAEAKQNRLFSEKGHNQARLAQTRAAHAADRQLALRQQDLTQELEILKRLGNLLKGNAFVRYLAQGSLLSLAHEASHILFSLTNSRYQLEMVDDGLGGDFILVDNYNGGLRRKAGSLSGGETFLASLALALALSRKIEMNSAPLGFFFLDEGFGSLDDNALEAALAVLERLPSDQRAVGVITHVRGVKERMPRYLLISADPLHGSQVALKIN